MSSASHRVVASSLVEDLDWLEKHCRAKPELFSQAGEVRLAAGLVRNVIRPFLESHPASPLHVAVVGGAGAGKSTIVNFLCGSRVAEANPQAGYTRHPIAFTGPEGPGRWPGQLGFLGPLAKIDTPQPSNLDQDVYQIRSVDSANESGGVLSDFVVWDCPDMTTWAAGGYVSRLMEISALADIVVYVASDERYNDEVPTQYLRLLLEVGKPVIVVLTKMRPENAAALIQHFQANVLASLPKGRVTVQAVPYLTPAQLAKPEPLANDHRVPLINQVFVLGDPAHAARKRSVDASLNFLGSASERLLAVARDDVRALEEWNALVREGRREFEERYFKEFLSAERFRRFDESLVRMVELLEFPGAGKVVSNTLWVVRTPYRLLKGAVNKALSRGDSQTIPEETVLDAALTGWLDKLRAESLRKSDQHPLWRHMARAFEGDLGSQTRERFRQGFRQFQSGLTDEVDRTARAIYEDLEKSPTTLTALRSSKLALDVLAIGGVIAAGGLSVSDVILVPLSASVAHQLVEWGGAAYVDNQREQTRQRQRQLVESQISAPLEDWLARWPATGGTEYERLQKVLKQVPESIRDLQRATEQVRRERAG